MQTVKNNTEAKPRALRAIFILQIALIVISTGMFTVFSLKDISLGGIQPIQILYTTLAYVGILGGMVLTGTKRWIWGFRLFLLATFLVSLPLKAFIGLTVSVITLGLSFHQKARAYFHGSLAVGVAG
ncbi:MAG TPA: hypothetical protein DCE41_07775 [Cytophagales bacterium]|nr:hypothetical protein [Cytophagales bacterium]HAA18767.1 hypothetical protein [Cytophagales bacterium]HAP64245.1 hypothetical protein [Cytophagales bacterium]